MKLATNHSNWEIGAYFLIWIGGVSYSIYSVYLCGNEINFQKQEYYYFSPGLFQRMKDVSDYEWEMAKVYISSLIPWILVHIVISEILRKIAYKLLPIWYTCITLHYGFINFGPLSVALLLLQPCVCVLLIMSKNKMTIWIFCIIALTVTNTLRFPGYFLHSYIGIDENDYFMLMVALSWMTLKCISCSLEIINKNEKYQTDFDEYDLMKLLGYTMYLPTLLFGPVILYDKFDATFSNNVTKSLKKRSCKMFLNLCRFTAWLIFTEVALHFVYVTALQSYIQIIQQSSWSVYGLGYCMGQFFHLKYVVMYGLTTTIASAEGIEVPPIPKCIGRIHLYSYMWKYFDNGLYNFLVRYIYLPSGGNKKYTLNKLQSSFLCFCFIFVWHGIQFFIFLWTVLNFISVLSEKIGDYISQTSVFKQNVEKQFSQQNVRRIKAFLSCPLLAMSAISNFIFFGGTEIGSVVTRQIFKDEIQKTALLMFFIYTLCQVSTEVRNWEEKRKLKNK